MADEEPIDQEALTEAFAKEARQALATPTWCTRFYVHAIGASGATIAFGGANAYRAENGTGPVEYVGKAHSAQWVDRDTALALCAFLMHFLNITDDELRECRLASFGVAVPKKAN